MKIMASDCDAENMISSSSSSESQNRRKRSRICRESSFRLSKGSPNVVKSYDHKQQRNAVFGIQKNLRNTCNSVLSSDNSLAPVYILPHLSGTNVGNVGVEGCYISKEIDYAITKIESLIPSLQVNSVHITNKTRDAHSGQGESMLTLLQKEENPKMGHVELVNETVTQTMIVKPPSIQIPENIQGLRIMALTHHSITGVKFSLEKGMSSQSIRNNTDGVLQATSSCELSPESGSSRSSSSEIYDTSSINESYESEVERREVENSQSYDTLSYYYSTEEDRYSDTSHVGERVKRDQNLERGKRSGKFRRFKNKLGKIFHHHHHHHHHHIHNKKDEAGYVRSFWKHLGSVFHHTKKSDGEKKPKVENLTKKTMTKSVTIKKQQEGGHFPALFQRLKTHLKHSKKPMDEIGRPGNSIRGSKRLKKQITLMPKRGGGIKFPNKGRVKIVNRSKSFAVAKKILT